MQALGNRGVEKAAIGNYSQQSLGAAIDDYTRPIVINPDNEHAHGNRGAKYRRLSQTGKAMIDFSKALTIDPLSSDQMMQTQFLGEELPSQYSEGCRLLVRTGEGQHLWAQRSVFEIKGLVNEGLPKKTKVHPGSK